MAAFKSIPELVRINGKWVIHPFEPMQAAFDWEKLRGKLATLYIVECAGYHKIGLTTDFKKRLTAIDLGNPLPVSVVATRNVPQAGLSYAEAWLHQKFSEKRVKGEWFSITRSEALKALPMAVRRAAAYAERCGQWHVDETARLATPEARAKALAGYEEFKRRSAELGIEIPAI